MSEAEKVINAVVLAASEVDGNNNLKWSCSLYTSGRLAAAANWNQWRPKQDLKKPWRK